MAASLKDSSVPVLVVSWMLKHYKSLGQSLWCNIRQHQVAGLHFEELVV
jgi:hypothetical protein